MTDTYTGTTLDERYRITGFLRAGRMGDIYMARRIADNRKVAVKVLDPGLFNNEEAVRRFERESKITRTIDHACTTRVLDFGRTEQGPYLIIEYVEGELLSDVIDEHGALAPERAARVCAQIALALQAAHDAGVIHRDLAPSNVLVAQQGDHRDLVKVTDFGLSRLTHDNDDGEDTNLTAVGVRIGTPTYMAPEYIEEYELDHRADIYGLGVMLFEMLTGSPPFTGRPYKVMEAQVHSPMPKPSTRAKAVPDWLDELVLHMTAKDPKDRPACGRDVASAVEAGLGSPVPIFEYVAPTASPAPPREVAPAQATPALDPILLHFLQVHSPTIGTPRKPPARSKMYVVERVAAVSIAAELGIHPGWWLSLPDEPTDGLLETALYKRVTNRRRWQFFPPDLQGEGIEATTTGLPIGLTIIRSPENVLTAYDPLLPDASALLDLWKQERYEDLEKLAWQTMTQAKGGGLFARFRAAEKPKLFDHPAYALWGAALAGQGKLAEGARAATDYNAKYAQHWPGVYSAIASLTIAREKALKEVSAGAEHARQALALSPSPQISAFLKGLTGEEAPDGAWLGRTFSDYSMDAVDVRASARLSDTLGQMDGSQLLGVCMMGGFRGNIDYDEFMHRWAQFCAFFPEFLVGLHVVTTATDRETSKPEHYVGEGIVRAAGVPMLVLQDYRAFVQRAVKPGAIPTVYLLDRAGVCVHEGALTEVELWNALALAAKHRLERFQGSAT